MNLAPFFDWAFWVVLASLILGIVVGSVLGAQKQESALNKYRQTEEKLIVYVYAASFSEMVSILEQDGFFREGWKLESFEYDKENQLFIVLLRRGDRK